MTHKLLSENPERYPDATLQGIRELLGLEANPSRIAALRTFIQATLAEYVPFPYGTVTG